MTKYTSPEIAAINAAWRSIREICTRTNWTDAGQWREAEKLERKQIPSDCEHPATWARAIICAQWLEGLENQDRPASKIYWIRPGALSAFLLGVRHAVERMGDDYNGPIVEEARALCRAAIEANESHSRRIVGGE